MQRTRACWLLFIFLLLLLSACGSTPLSRPVTSQPVTEVPTIPLNIPFRTVHFTTSDHVQLAGQLYGHGKTIVICSHESATDGIWIGTGLPQRLAALNYQVLLYNFRGYGGSEGPIDESQLDVDLLAAINFAHQQGATRIVLMGASMGGTASLKVASEEPVAAVISISGPQVYTISVSDAEIKAIRVPKLFIDSKDDGSFVYDSEHMESIASPPKEIYIYPGGDHGTDIFDGDNGADPAQRVLHFIQEYASVS